METQHALIPRTEQLYPMLTDLKVSRLVLTLIRDSEQSPAAKLNCFDLLMRDHKASILAEYVEQAPSTEKAPENQGRRVKIQCKT